MYDGTVTAVRGDLAPGTHVVDSYGNTITIQSTINGQTYSIFYAHLDGIGQDVKVGATIKQGQFLGKSGSTGNAGSRTVYFKHLHIEVKDSNGKKIDPEPFFKSKFDPKTGKNDTCK